MTEPESPARPRLNRSILGRLAAVGLFLGLGTLAVMHTVTNRKPDAQNAAATAQGSQDSATNNKQTAAPANQQASTSSPPKSSSPNSLPPIVNNPSAKNASFSLGDQPTSANPQPSPRLSNPLSLPTTNFASPAKSPTLPSLPPPSTEANKLLDGSKTAPDASAPIGPPAIKSFGDSTLKSPNNDLRSANPAPLVSAQIDVETDGTPPSPEGARSSPPATSSKLPDLISPIKSPSTNPPITAGANPLGQTNVRQFNDSNDLQASTETSRTNSVGASLTPYDSPSIGSATKRLTDKADSAAQSAGQLLTDTPNKVGAAAPSNAALNSKNPPALPSSNMSEAPRSPSNQSSSEFPSIRSAIPGAMPTPKLGANTNSSFGSLASNSRPVEARDVSPTAPLAVQATPGPANLEGVQVPTLKLQKIAPREVQVNKPTELQLIVQNTGQAPAAQVTVYDRVPEGTRLIDSSPKANQSGDATLTWNLGTIAPGETSKITLNLLPVRPGEFGSVAQVTFAAQASARTLCTQPLLTIKHSAKPKTLIGDEVVLDITIENNGDGPATNVMLQETVPDLLTFADGSRELEFEVGTLAPKQKRNVQLRLKAAKVGTAQNQIVAQADADIQTSDAIDLEVIAPDLRLAAEGPDRKYLNRQATHEFALTNGGTATATNVDLIAHLPRGLKFVSANNHGQYDPNTNSVYWSLQQLAAGQTGKVELATLPTEPGEHKIEFEATADLNLKTALSKSLAVENLVELFCDIDDLTDPIEIGGETAYRVKVVNQGLQPATNIRLNVDFPAGIVPTNVSGNISHQIQGQRVVFSPIDRLNPQQETVVTISAKGTSEGDHRVVVSMSSDARETQIAKEESTQVYSDRR